MKLVPTLGLFAAVVAFGGGSAIAQTTQSGTAQTGPTSGITSGPASPSGHSTTLGSEGHLAETPHQAGALQNQNPNSTGNSGGQVGQKPGQQ